MSQDNISYSTTFNSALFRALARDATRRCSGGRSDFEAITAIILAYTALEAFMNEVSQLSQTLLRKTPLEMEYGETERPSWLNQLALAMRVSEEQKASTVYKYDLTFEILSGTKINRGEGNRQRLKTLSDLRNELVHMKSRETEISMRIDPARTFDDNTIWRGEAVEKHPQPACLRYLDTPKVLAEGDEYQDWIFRICSRETANWACDTVEQAAHHLLNQAPSDSEFRKRLQDYSLGGTFYRESQGS